MKDALLVPVPGGGVAVLLDAPGLRLHRVTACICRCGSSTLIPGQHMAALAVLSINQAGQPLAAQIFSLS